MDIVTLAAARKGSGGGASKEYVDEKVAALINDTTAAQNKTYSSAKVEEKVAGEEITATATGSDLTLSTSKGNVNALTVYGKSEVVDGAIVSAGEGYAVVRLADLTWRYASGHFISNSINSTLKLPISNQDPAPMICSKYKVAPWSTQLTDKIIISPQEGPYHLWIKDVDYTTVSDFIASLGDATLCYELADPTQGNCIAIKTDDGTGINGTMATFTTGTPLRGIPDTTVRDVMVWDGSTGTVTKNCGKGDLGSFDYERREFRGVYYFRSNNIKTTVKPVADTQIANLYMINYEPVPANDIIRTAPNHTIAVDIQGDLYIRTDEINNVPDFKTAMNGVMLLYELATPTTEQLTSTENASIAGLRTFEPQTHAQNNAGATMTVEAYAGTGNGKAVSELKQDVQSEISALKITQSATLMLAVADWSSNQQTVTYAHDTAKRNVIDVDPSSVEEWADCGVLATSETATSITFTCKTVPENALNFRVTSMGV